MASAEKRSIPRLWPIIRRSRPVCTGEAQLHEGNAGGRAVRSRLLGAPLHSLSRDRVPSAVAICLARPRNPTICGCLGRLPRRR